MVSSDIKLRAVLHVPTQFKTSKTANILSPAPREFRQCGAIPCHAGMSRQGLHKLLKKHGVNATDYRK